MPVPFAAGVLIVEVSKRHHSPAVQGIGEAVRKPLEVLDGMIKPAKGSVSGRNNRRPIGHDATRAVAGVAPKITATGIVPGRSSKTDCRLLLPAKAMC